MLDRPPPSGRYAPRDRADPREVPPNANLAGPNDPPQSVGPTSSTNAPGNFVLPASAWSGWPAADTIDAGGVWATPPMEEFSGGGGEWSGFGYGRQNPGGYMRRVSTAMTCADLNGRQLASFPAYAVNNRRPSSLPSWYSSPEPELYSDWTAFMKALSNSYYLAGEAILWATGRFADGWPARFVALNPSQVFVDDEGNWYLGHDDHGDPLARADICHIPYQQLPGTLQRRGIGPLRWAWGNLMSAATLNRYAENIARYGVWAVLKHPDELTAAQSADLQGQWMTARYHSAGAPAVLSGGLEFETLTMSPKDLALLDLLWFDLEMIAAAMGVPAVLVNLPQNNGLTYQSTLMLADWHWRATLRTAAESMSGAMSQWLLPRGSHIEFNPDRYTQPPLEERARAYATLHGIVGDDGGRALEVDEIREFERWAPHEADVDPGGGIEGLIGSVRG